MIELEHKARSRVHKGKGQKSHTDMTHNWRRLTPPPFLTFEENGQLVKADGKERFPITINTLFRLVNSELSEDDPLLDSVCRWLGMRTPQTWKELGLLMNDPSLAHEDLELLYLVHSTRHYEKLVRVARAVLNQIVERNQTITQAAEFSTHSQQAMNEAFRAAMQAEIYAGRSHLTVSEDGTFTAVADPVLLLFHNMGKTERIRKCAICEKFFWAGRIKAQCCSPRCNNTRIKRKARSEEAKGLAKANRIYREQLKEKRGKKR
jgi:hypothetical protein